MQHRRSLASKPEVLEALGYPNMAHQSSDGSSYSRDDGAATPEGVQGGTTHPSLERVSESRVHLGNGIHIPGTAFSGRNGLQSVPPHQAAGSVDLFLDLRPFMSLAPLCIR